MMLLLALAQPVMHVPADGIARAIPPTYFSCELTAADGSNFTVSGTTPHFPRGWDPNRSEFVELQSTHAEAFRKKVGIDPNHASEWFREYQVLSGYPGVPQYNLNLLLRKEGASVAYVTYYLSSGKQVPYEYYAVGLCKADFAPGGGEKGQP